MDISKHNIKLEILVATMYRTSLDFLEKMFPHHNIEALYVLVVNQTIKGKELTSHLQNIRVINLYDIGLSKSRNLALEHAIGHICLIADDDVEYLPNFENVIVKSFDTITDSSVVSFKIKTFRGKDYKSYPIMSKQLNKRKDIAKVSSIEIAFRRKDVIDNKVGFNTHFGLKSQFPSGEEYLFLKAVLKYNLNIYFEDKYIVKHKEYSSTTDVTKDSFLETKGAIYYIDYKAFAYVLAAKYVFFLLRKGKITIRDINSVYSKITKGIKAYKKSI